MEVLWQNPFEHLQEELSFLTCELSKAYLQQWENEVIIGVYDHNNSFFPGNINC